MLVISKLSVLASVDSSYSFVATHLEGDKEYYLYNTYSVSNVAPGLKQHTTIHSFDDNDDFTEVIYQLTGVSYSVIGDSVEDCFSQADSILSLQQQVFDVFPSAQFHSVNPVDTVYESDNEHLFMFEFKFPQMEMYPFVYVTRFGQFEWYCSSRKGRLEGKISCISLLLKAVAKEWLTAE